MTPLPVSVLVLGIGIARHQSIGYWLLGAKLGIVLTLKWTVRKSIHQSITLTTILVNTHTGMMDITTLSSWLPVCYLVNSNLTANGKLNINQRYRYVTLLNTIGYCSISTHTMANDILSLSPSAWW